MPVLLMLLFAFLLVLALPGLRALRRAPKAAPAMPLHTSDVSDMHLMMVAAYEEERADLHRQAVTWLHSLGRGPLRVTDAQAATGNRGCDIVTLGDGTVLGLSSTGLVMHELRGALDRFTEVALTRVRAARDGFELTFDMECGRQLHARAELLTVRGAWV
ncbi:hypothetical protein [Embleya sp. NBC_00896]|uniref:hypothetical protein n=1 Tax=Embleya sp. NBC_00896 TaxID=2975961 RepID=UPI003867D139|nr:hypothetical protein OG928_10340 [Embleya sp. NBC_00896]